MRWLQRQLYEMNIKINRINDHLNTRPSRGSFYLRELENALDQLDALLNFRSLDIPLDIIAEDAQIDVFLTYNSFSTDKTFMSPSNVTVYPLAFPYSGARGPRRDIEQVFASSLGKKISRIFPFVLGIEPVKIRPVNFKPTSILKPPVNLRGSGTLIGIIDTGIDYTSPAFIDQNGETRIEAIWDQTIGTSSPYGYGTLYDKQAINGALQSLDPSQLVPHKDEVGHGTILAGIAAGFEENQGGRYEGVAPEAELAVVKLKPASDAMQRLFHGKYNPLGFSALDIALAIQFLANLANQIGKPISICLPSGTNSGAHDGTNILDQIIDSYSANPGVCTVVAVGEEANKDHHASGDLKQEKEQEIKLIIAKGETSFFAEIWAAFGDSFDVLLVPPDNQEVSPILLNASQTTNLPDESSVWSQGSVFDVDTGCMVIRFRLENPVEGEWIIKVKSTIVVGGGYHIWIPKTGMIMPGTVLSPADPFTTIYNTSTAAASIAIGCYDRKSQSACASSGRGFTRDDRVSPDYLVDGVDIPGPLPDNKWGLITGTCASSAIVAGATSLIYENQIIKEEELANSNVMKAILADYVRREATISYPNPSTGYGVLEIKVDLS